MFRHRHEDRPALDARDRVEIEDETELEFRRLGQAARSAAARIPRDVGDECQPGRDAPRFKPGTEAAPSSEQVFARQHELEHPSRGILEATRARLLLCARRRRALEQQSERGATPSPKGRASAVCHGVSSWPRPIRRRVMMRNSILRAPLSPRGNTLGLTSAARAPDGRRLALAGRVPGRHLARVITDGPSRGRRWVAHATGAGARRNGSTSCSTPAPRCTSRWTRRGRSRRSPATGQSTSGTPSRSW